MTLVVLIATSALGLVMTVYLLGLANRKGYYSACGVLALAFLLISVSSALLSVHLVHDIELLVRIRGTLALVSVPCLYLYFVAAGSAGYALPETTPLHGLWLLGGLGAMATSLASLLDYILIAEMIFYIAALILIWRDRAQRFVNLREDGGKTVWWLGIVIIFLSISVMLEILILVDVSGGGLLKASMPLLLSMLSLGVLVSISLIGALGRPSLFEHLYSLAVDSRLNGSPPEQTSPQPEELELAAKALELLGDAHNLANPSLTITRLARKLGVLRRASFRGPSTESENAVFRIC